MHLEQRYEAHLPTAGRQPVEVVGTPPPKGGPASDRAPTNDTHRLLEDALLHTCRVDLGRHVPAVRGLPMTRTARLPAGGSGDTGRVQPHRPDQIDREFAAWLPLRVVHAGTASPAREPLTPENAAPVENHPTAPALRVVWGTRAGPARRPGGDCPGRRRAGQGPVPRHRAGGSCAGADQGCPVAGRLVEVTGSPGHARHNSARDRRHGHPQRKPRGIAQDSCIGTRTPRSVATSDARS